MKKFIMFLLAAFCFAGVAGGVANAQNLTAKQLKKNSKKIAKQKQKEGWEACNATLTLDVLYAKYNAYLMEDEENHIAIFGNARGTANKKIGILNATNAGINEYSARVAANVTGKIKSIAAAAVDNQGTSDEIDKFGAAFSTTVQNKIQGLVKRHFVLRKKDKTGNGYDYEAYLSIDKSKAADMAAAAAKEALDAYKLQNLSSQVKDFIGESMSEAQDEQ